MTILTTDTPSSPARVRYGVPFVSTDSDLSNSWITARLYNMEYPALLDQVIMAPDYIYVDE